MSFDTTTVCISANVVGRKVFSTSVAEEVGWGGLTRAYVMGLFPALTHSIWNDLDMKCKNPQGREELHKAHWSFSERAFCKHGAVCFSWPCDWVLFCPAAACGHSARWVGEGWSTVGWEWVCWGWMCFFLCSWINPESLTHFQVHSRHEREEMASRMGSLLDQS